MPGTQNLGYSLPVLCFHLCLVPGPLKLLTKTYFGKWKPLLEMRQQGDGLGSVSPSILQPLPGRCCLLCTLQDWGEAEMDTLGSHMLWTGTLFPS